MYIYNTKYCDHAPRTYLVQTQLRGAWSQYPELLFLAYAILRYNFFNVSHEIKNIECLHVIYHMLINNLWKEWREWLAVTNDSETYGGHSQFSELLHIMYTYLKCCYFSTESSSTYLSPATLQKSLFLSHFQAAVIFIATTLSKKASESG